MPSHSVFHWPDGAGWLVLAGGDDPSSAVRAQAIERTSADGGVAYVVLGDDATADATFDDMEALGAPSGYFVQALLEDDDTIRAQVGAAGLVVLNGSGLTAQHARSVLLGAVADGIEAAYQRGAVVLAEGAAAAVFGLVVLAEDGQAKDALDWVRGAYIAPGVAQPASHDEVRHVLAAQPTAVAVGIGRSSALALGPSGTVEVWGDRQVAVTLGAAYHTVPRDQGAM